MKKGFTLIELLVVVLIIGVLAAVALPQYRFAVEKARMAEAVIILDRVAKEMDLYALQNGKINSEDLDSIWKSAGLPGDYPNATIHDVQYAFYMPFSNLESGALAFEARGRKGWVLFRYPESSSYNSGVLFCTYDVGTPFYGKLCANLCGASSPGPCDIKTR